ncbi:MAG: T9SS type A sorting domain-containing protein [Gilvibacter sp.]
MKHYYFVLTLFTLVISSLNSYAQDAPFNCDYNAYLFQRNDVFALNLASGSAVMVATDITEGNVNATGYNPIDGYIWGSVSSPSKTIVRIGNNFEVSYFNIDALPTSNRYIGDVSQEGIYYLKPSGSTVYRIDLRPESETYTQALETVSLSLNISIHDWAFNAVDNMLYTVEKSSNILYRINPITGLVTSLGEVPILSGNRYTYGAVYFDSEGRFYVSANQTGTIYVIQNVQNIIPGDLLMSNVFAFGPSSSSNDGARCPTAPVPQEDCSNGIDDDGDGLIDCDDPSCSGVAECPIIETSSGGNEGGLESNNRLSTAIGKRNFNRAKSNYKFDPLAQPIINKAQYVNAKNGGSTALIDLVPIDALIDTQVIESTPLDLIQITNATEILAFDYLRDSNTVAAVMAFTTEGRVYEHTKYICDRLLGGEILSISTIEIYENNFITTQIKNPDGSIEFVLSITATLSEDQESFTIESHWNLDRYLLDRKYYTVQLWANSIDDLYTLGNSFLDLAVLQKPVDEFRTSTPPRVYARTARYTNGNLDLTLVNTNNSPSVAINGGYRLSETLPIQDVSVSQDLNGDYIQNIRLNSGSLFDFGFRIEAIESESPDDLYLSDGVWGLDSDETLNMVRNYEVIPQEQLDSEGLRLERGVRLDAQITQNIAIYRSFTPRFKGADISNFNALTFIAKGSGSMEVVLPQANIANWEDQPRAQVNLSDQESSYTIPLTQFSNNAPLTNTTTVVFSFPAQEGSRALNFEIKELVFKSLSEESLLVLENQNTMISPNPWKPSSVLSWNSTNAEAQKISITNLIGQTMIEFHTNSQSGLNQFSLDQLKLSSGMYIVIIQGSSERWSHKLLIK